MFRSFLVVLSLLMLAAPANALSFEELKNTSIDDFVFEDYEFVAETAIPSQSNGMMALCHRTRVVRILGYDVTSDVLGYVLKSKGCAGPELREFSTDQMITAQSLDFIDPSIPPAAQNTWERNIQTYGVLAAVILAMLAVIIRRLKSIFGSRKKGQLRRKAANKILRALCHAAKCDGLVASREIKLIAKTMQRLTGRTYSTAEIMRLSDRVHINLGPQDYINFGAGLRDREKDIMLKGVLYITMAGDRMLPAEYKFSTELAHGLGIPGEDFRRVLYDAFTEREENPF